MAKKVDKESVKAVAAGLCIGVAIGIALDSIATGIGVGLALGAAYCGAKKNKTGSDDDLPGPNT